VKKRFQSLLFQICQLVPLRLGVISVNKGAHMIFVTTMAYNADGSVVLSGSADASACAHRVNKSGGVGTVLTYLMLLVVVGLYVVYAYLYVVGLYEV
jgi:hypothetical protein